MDKKTRMTDLISSPSRKGEIFFLHESRQIRDPIAQNNLYTRNNTLLYTRVAHITYVCDYS